MKQYASLLAIAAFMTAVYVMESPSDRGNQCECPPAASAPLAKAEGAK